jgi:hypothetical protein
MCACPGVNWDLVSVVQKKGESLREFIQCFYNKRNIIPEKPNGQFLGLIVMIH